MEFGDDLPDIRMEGDSARPDSLLFARLQPVVA